MRGWPTVVALVGLLGASAGVALWAWRELGAVDISRHGLIALGLGAGVSFLLGAGLMALMFFSSRRGYDERARALDERPRADRRPAPADEA